MVIHKALFLLLWRKQDGKLTYTCRDHTGPFPRLARERTARQAVWGGRGGPTHHRVCCLTATDSVGPHGTCGRDPGACPEPVGMRPRPSMTSSAPQPRLPSISQLRNSLARRGEVWGLSSTIKGGKKDALPSLPSGDWVAGL